MNDKKKNVPVVRFNGFSDAWEQRKLGDHAKYRRGSFPQPYGNKEWYDGEGAMPFVQVVDVTSKLTLVENTKQKISKLAQPKSVFVPKGKVIVTLQGSIGRVAITQYDSFVDRTLLIFDDYEKETDERFWAYTIQKKFEIEKLKAPGGTIKTITKEALSSFDVHLPQFEEQQKIGILFKQLDNTIALHQRKLDALMRMKKGFLQQLFPGNGKKILRVRFAGFDEEWEQRKLGDHAKYRRGSFPQPYGNKEWYDGEGAMPFVQVVDVTSKLTLVENTKQKISKLAQPKGVFVPKGKVIVTLQGSIGRVAITQYDSFVDRTLLIFDDYEKETDERFWAYTIQKKFEIEKLKAPGGTIKTITKEALSSFDVHLPQFEEQQKIGILFKQLDNTIALHQQKLEQLQTLKEAYLQNMFI
ncbi:type I restriction enzyme S subunit [Enterococcus rotai]|uniref:Type I restriction modification DNA specificity domain-containing protein n=1 Tax=Enterococcus rotai TaxID=118060 RepID=A0A0U2VT07_9ENTE|nr:restriction endonuclease subunit S [Enterococcus rotai]ALS37503.1 hypothetical protein ATZ35_10165 [Enterococcus rotai]